MQDLLVVTVLDGERDLSEPVEKLILRHVVLATLPVSGLEPLLNLLLQVSIIGIVHNDAKLALLRLVNFAEAGNVNMVEDLQDFRLVQCLATLLFAHLRDINLLDNRQLVVAEALHKISSSKGTSAECADLLIRLKCLRGLFSRACCFYHFSERVSIKKLNQI